MEDLMLSYTIIILLLTSLIMLEYIAIYIVTEVLYPSIRDLLYTEDTSRDNVTKIKPTPTIEMSADENNEACEGFKENLLGLLEAIMTHMNYFNAVIKTNYPLKKDYEHKIVSLADIEDVRDVCKKKEAEKIIDPVLAESKYFWDMIHKKDINFLIYHADSIFSFVPDEQKGNNSPLRKILTTTNKTGEKITSEKFVETCFDYFDALVDDMKVREKFINDVVKQKVEERLAHYKVVVEKLNAEIKVKASATETK